MEYGDWPINVDAQPFEQPDQFLLSYGKPVTVSSGTAPEKITNERARDWWRADNTDLQPVVNLDLEQVMSISSVQINFADDQLTTELTNSMEIVEIAGQKRGISNKKNVTRWQLEGSLDGNMFQMICDKSRAETDYPHDFILFEKPLEYRYLRLTIIELPYGQTPYLSGLRVFGKASKNLPKIYSVEVELGTDLDCLVTWQSDQASGHLVRWGYAADKLYHSYMVYGENSLSIRALIKEQPLFVRLDAFNEAGVVEGEVIQVL